MSPFNTIDIRLVSFCYLLTMHLSYSVFAVSGRAPSGGEDFISVLRSVTHCNISSTSPKYFLTCKKKFLLLFKKLFIQVSKYHFFSFKFQTHDIPNSRQACYQLHLRCGDCKETEYTVESVNPTHQGTRKMCGIVQDVVILRFYFS